MKPLIFALDVIGKLNTTLTTMTTTTAKTTAAITATAKQVGQTCPASSCPPLNKSVGSGKTNCTNGYNFGSHCMYVLIMILALVGTTNAKISSVNSYSYKCCRPYFEIAHTCSRTKCEDQFLYANFSAPLLLVRAPSVRLLWRWHWC